MSQQIIDIGAEANDGTGEPLRSAFNAVNENFTEVYAAGPVGSNVTITGNTITVSGINNNLVLAANGIGNVQSNSTIMPSTDAVYDLGAANMRFGDIHGTYIYGNGAFLTGIAGGGSGNAITSGATSVSIPVINGNVAVTIDGRGNVLVVQRQNVVVAANIVPSANVTYSLGTAANAWQDLYLSNSTIYLGNSTIQSNATSFTLTTPTGGALVFQGNGIVNSYANANVAGYLLTNTGNIRGGNISATGNVTGQYIIGDGGFLSNIVFTGNVAVSQLGNGTTVLRVDGSGGNLISTVGGVSNVQVVTPAGVAVIGNISATGNITGNYILGNGSQLSGLPETYANANVAGYLLTNTGNIAAGNLSVTGNISAGNLSVTSNISAGNISAAATISAVGNVRTQGAVSATGNITTEGFFIGNFAGNITGNLTVPGSNTQVLFNGEGNAAAVAGFTYNADSNTVGVLGVVSAQGNVIAGNVVTAGNVSANYFLGNGSALTSVTGANVTGTVATAATAATVTTAAQPNITSVGTLTNLSVTGNIDAARLIVNNITSNDSSILIIDDGLEVNGDLTVGNVIAGNISAVGNITGNYVLGNGSQLTGMYSNTDVAAYLPTYTGNLVALTGNVTTTANVSASYILGNGSQLTNVNAVTVDVTDTNGLTTVYYPTFVENRANSQIARADVDLTYRTDDNLLTVGNINTGTVSATGNITGSYILGNVANLTNNSNTFSMGSTGVLSLGDAGGTYLTLDRFGITANTQMVLSAANASTGNNSSILFDKNGGGISIRLEDNDGPSQAFWSFYQSNITFPDGSQQFSAYANANVTAYLPTYTGNLASLQGNVTTAANISGNFILGNGSQLTGLPEGYANANVSTYLASGTNSANIITTANISASFLLGNGAFITGLPANYGNTEVAAFLPTYTGNLAALTGNVTTTANISGGNISSPGAISATGNITGSFIFGNGSQLTGVVSSYGNSNVAAYLPTYTGNLANLQGNVTTTANISGGNVAATGAISTAIFSATGNAQVGNLNTTGVVSANTISTTGNALVGGDLIVNGNVTYINVTDLNVEDPIIGFGRGANNAPLTTNDGKDRGEQLWYYTDSEQSAFVGYDNSAAKMIVAANVNISNEIVTVNNYGNTVVGNLESTTVTASSNVTGGNINTGGAVNATGNLIGGNVSTAGLITATGNIGGSNVNTSGVVSATGNLIGGNVSTAGIITATGNIIGGNVNTTNLSLSGNVISALNITGNVTSGNIAAVAAVSAATVSASGNITGGNIVTAGNISGANVISGTTVSVSGNVAGANINAGFVSATGNIDSLNINIDNVYADAVSVTGNVVTGNINTAGRVSATGNVIGGNVISGALISAATASVTGTVTGGNLATGGTASAAGNITGGNIATAGQVVATANITGGNLATGGTVSAAGNITGGNIVTSNTVSALDMFATGNVSAVGNVISGNIVSQGTASVTGNVTAGNIVTAGLISATGTITSAATITGGNLVSTAELSSAGNITAAGNVIATNFVGNLVGNLTAPGSNTQLIFNESGVLGGRSGLVFDYVGNALTVGGDIATQNGGNISAAGALSVTGNITVSTGNINGGNIRGTVISASGNVLGGNVSTGGVITATGNISGGNINTAGQVVATANVTGGNLTTAGQVVATANITGGNISTAGLITATGNITSTANVAGGNIVTGGVFVATGNITGGNISTAGLITATGNIASSANIVATGNVAGGNIIASNLTATRVVIAGTNGVLTDVSGFEFTTANSTLTVANIAATVIDATGNVAGGNISTAGLITATGNITGGNLLASTLSLSGNVLSAINMIANITTTGNISANNIAATTSINIAGNPVATVDDATALAIALG